MDNNQVLQNLKALMNKAQKSGVLELNEVPVILEMYTLIETAFKELGELKEIKKTK